MSEWKPIDTAPKDGTVILTVIADTHPDTGEPFIPSLRMWDGYWADPNFSEEELEELGVEISGFEPTHWAHLPEYRALCKEAAE